MNSFLIMSYLRICWKCSFTCNALWSYSHRNHRIPFLVNQ